MSYWLCFLCLPDIFTTIIDHFIIGVDFKFGINFSKLKKAKFNIG